jgi:hypothetical protein
MGLGGMKMARIWSCLIVRHPYDPSCGLCGSLPPLGWPPDGSRSTWSVPAASLCPRSRSGWVPWPAVPASSTGDDEAGCGAPSASRFLLGCDAWCEFASKARTASRLQASRRPPLSIELSISPTMEPFAEPKRQPPKPPLNLPAALLHVNLILPRFSEAGPYTIIVVAGREGTNLIAYATGNATLNARSASRQAWKLCSPRRTERAV